MTTKEKDYNGWSKCKGKNHYDMKETCIITCLYGPCRMKMLEMREQISQCDKICDKPLDLLTTLHNYSSSSTISLSIDHFSNFPKAHYFLLLFQFNSFISFLFIQVYSFLFLTLDCYLLFVIQSYEFMAVISG